MNAAALALAILRHCRMHVAAWDRTPVGHRAPAVRQALDAQQEEIDRLWAALAAAPPTMQREADGYHHT